MTFLQINKHSQILYFFFVIFISLCSCHNANSQQSQLTTKKQGWSGKVDFGFDILSNLFINPTVGSGENRFNIGSSLNIQTVYNQGKFSWVNDLNMAYGIQKIRNRGEELDEESENAFKKNIDNLWVNNKFLYRTSYFSKFYYSADLFFTSQLTKTYEDNYITDITDSGQPISNFLSPGLLQVSLGLDFQPNDYWSILISPLSYKSILVLDDEIANNFVTDNAGEFLGSLHGNQFTRNTDGTINFQNYNNQFGAAVRLTFKNEFSKRLSIYTNLLLFSNYRKEPEHIDVNWRNEISFSFFKGFSLSLLSSLNYDHDVFVQISDNDAPSGFKGFGRRVSYSQQLVFKYSYNFDSNKKTIKLQR